ncbi:uncharacterized protein LOC116203644 isoform X2 [Punica granatum]|uniref:Uncharacterized protein LOC116203644 isoform X2 n=1 Tax=Punica granatum TaxID=22663 RepID=A0A6P8DCW8_PUNGR|nr:uncharacterized protein LOC116203644 isoform X2 [Punica granatum]
MLSCQISPALPSAGSPRSPTLFSTHHHRRRRRRRPSLSNAFKSEMHLPFRPFQADFKARIACGNDEEEDEDEDDVAGQPKRFIQIPRQKYIPVSKSELLDAIAMSMFDTPEDARQFLDVSSCLDSVLHAEQKGILEEMRADYSFFTAFATRKDGDAYEDDTLCRVAIATRFQRALMGLLKDAQFEELSTKDLMLVSALNTDYLLTLPISVDWKKASQSNAIIFRRGYTTEKQKGLLLAEKLDYIQSRLLQRIIFVISKPLAKVASWMFETIESSDSTQQIKDLANKMKHRFLDVSDFQRSYIHEDKNWGDKLQVGSESVQELPIWVAAQRAIAHYEAFLSSNGPRGRLLRKFLTWTGLAAPAPETQFELENDNNATDPYLRPILLSRISLGDIWKPAAERWYGNDIWEALRTSVSILFSQSILQEAAFQELMLLYIKEMNEKDVSAESGVGLQLKIYKSIPIPDLPVIFPYKKLYFRIIDSVRLDVATLLGLLAYIINYKFEDIRSAILFDAIAITALIVFAIRVVLGYKQTSDRYQLLVNKTLYEKTEASGFGSVHFLLDASEQQKFKEAILAYAILLRANNSQMNCRQRIGDECERFVYNMFKQQVDMPVDKALETLLRLGLATETYANGSTSLQAIPCPKACQALKERWNTFLV